MQIIYFIVMAAVIIGIGTYLYHFLKKRTEFYQKKTSSKKTRGLLGVISAVIVGGCLNISSMFTLIVLHIVVLSMVLDGINAIMKCIGNRKKETGTADRPGKAQRIWRNLYGSGLIPLFITALFMGYGYYNMHHVVEKDYVVTTKKNIGQEEIKVAMISDLHFGTIQTEESLPKITQEIEAANPDLIVLCGDLVDESTTLEQMEAAFSILGEMDSKYGTFYIYGNHDRQPYIQNKKFTEQQLEEAILNAGIHILQDEVWEVNENLVLVGREDIGFGYTGSRKSMESLLEGVKPDQYILVLDHQPEDVKENVENGCDLQLSGHTHGGQIWPGGVVNDLMGVVNYGRKKNGEFEIIVSSGIAGWGYPIRTAYHSEWVMVTIMGEE